MSETRVGSFTWPTGFGMFSWKSCLKRFIPSPPGDDSIADRDTSTGPGVAPTLEVSDT